MIDSDEEIHRCDWKTRTGTRQLHLGLHWINLELSEFTYASPAERPEELADVLHFLVEFSLLAGFRFNRDVGEYSEGDWLDIVLDASKEDPFVFDDALTNARFCIMATLQVADLLKNKPWKQTLKTERDEEEWRRRIYAIWYWFGATCRTAGLSSQDVFDQFMAKEKINYTRISTGV
jgi:hypothetical protein